MKKIILKKRWRLRKKNLILKILSWIEAGNAASSYENTKERRESELMDIIKKTNMN